MSTDPALAMAGRLSLLERARPQAWSLDACHRLGCVPPGLNAGVALGSAVTGSVAGWPGDSSTQYMSKS